ncbi:MAG: hypothetical protein K0U12_04760 [Gammaproteobacteria bacterium]|nr:hypothetical protein [Gammaproteobacteria bacterium]
MPKQKERTTETQNALKAQYDALNDELKYICKLLEFHTFQSEEALYEFAHKKRFPDAPILTNPSDSHRATYKFS